MSRSTVSIDMLKRLDVRGIEPADLPRQLPRPTLGSDEPVEVVRGILRDVQDRGDAALRDYTQRFDGVTLDAIRVPLANCEVALGNLAPDLRAALVQAHEAITQFHVEQLRDPHDFERDGILVQGYHVPVDRAGLYVPGGRAVYPSTVLMTATVARVAGVDEIALCVPPERSTGTVPAATLAAAALAGVTEVYSIGGAQAIAALAYGTESIRPVDVIVGPGNAYVAIAKREVAGSGRVAVPSSFAGPSEVVVITDESVPPAFAAIDLLVQAEHGPGGLSWLLCWSEAVAERVEVEMARLIQAAPRKADIVATLDGNGYMVLCDGPEQAIAVANIIAPEHLELLCDSPETLVPYVRHAGAVFCGPLSPASIGDYIAGPSHVLPTFGSARFASALTVDDFLKQLHVVTVSKEGFERVAPHVVALAQAEGLDAHAQSILLRQVGG